MTYCLNVKIDIKPERREEFLACIQANQAGTLSKEPLARYYIWGEESDNSNVFRFHERYEGKAGFEAHSKQPHFANWEKFASTDPFRTPPEVFFWEEHGGTHPNGAAAPEASSRHYTLNGKICVKPEQREEFIKAFSANQAGSLKESSVIDFTFGADTSDPNVFHFFERYAGGREALESHKKTDHFAEFKKFAESGAFAQPPAVAVYQEIVPGAVEMKVTSKKSTGFYTKSAKAFLGGVEDKDGKKREPVKTLHISGLGDAITIASAVAATVEAEGLASIGKIETSYPEMNSASGGRGCARILISLEKK